MQLTPPVEFSPENIFGKISESFKSNNKKFNIIAGPCAIENEEMINIIAKELSSLGVRFLRGGIYKPRTSPHNFQGLQKDGLQILKDAGKKYNMYTISEVVDTRHVDMMSQFVDVFQIGSRNMQNFELLKEIGRSQHPVLLKKGMSSTIEEFKLASDYIAQMGNKNIIMCERGIRTFETQTRNTLDIACVPIIQQKTNFPVVVDLSHSLGRKDIIINVARAIIALGADGIMVEVHNDPPKALSDNKQQLSINEFKQLLEQCYLI